MSTTRETGVTVGYCEPQPGEAMEPQATVNSVLHGLLRYEEILGAIAVSVDGIVIGSALSKLITANDGMMTVRNAGSFALTILSDQTDPPLVVCASQTALAEIAMILNPIQAAPLADYA